MRNPSRVALYLRRSTEEHQEASLEVQEEQARRFCEKMLTPYELASDHIFVDSGVSRAEFAKRPGLVAMLRAVEKGEVDFVVTRDETRLGGDMVRVSLLLQNMVDAGARIYYYYTGEEVQLNDAVSKFMMTARNFASELEREKIAQRTHEHLLVKARKGLNVGGRCYGYNNNAIFDGERRKHVEYEVNPEQAAVIVEIFTRYATGDGLRTIARDLNARAIPSAWAGKRGSGSWAPSQIWELLRRERYLGVLVWNQMEKMYRKGTKVRVRRPEHEWIRLDVPHLRIVSDELWAGAHAQMRANSATTARQATKRGAEKLGGRPATYLLSGITKCGLCGGSLTVVSSRDGKTPIKAYICSYRHDRGDAVCANKLRRPVEGVNDAVVNWVRTNILSEEIVLDTLKEVRRRLSERAKRSDEDVPHLEGEAHKLRTQIENLVDVLAGTPKKNATGIVAGIHERQEKLDALDARIRAIKVAPEAVQLEVRRMEVEIKARLENLRETLERHPTEARAIVTAVFGGKLTATPVDTFRGRRFQVEGTASIGRMLAIDTIETVDAAPHASGGSTKTPLKDRRPQRESNPR